MQNLVQKKVIKDNWYPELQEYGQINGGKGQVFYVSKVSRDYRIHMHTLRFFSISPSVGCVGLGLDAPPPPPPPPLPGPRRGTRKELDWKKLWRCWSGLRTVDTSRIDTRNTFFWLSTQRTSGPANWRNAKMWQKLVSGHIVHLVQRL